MMIGPLRAVVGEENALRLDRTAVNSKRPVGPFTDPLAGNVGTPEVALVSVPVELTPVPVLETAPKPNPTSAAPILLALVPELVTVALMART